MGIEIFKNGIYKAETGFIASSKTWLEASRHRKQINLNDAAVTRYDNFVIIDMSGWTNKPAAANWTNYVRVYECLDATEVQTEIKSQTIDQSWAGGNHDAVIFFNTQTDTKSTFIVYYGDTDLGATGYTNSFTITAHAPNAGDFTVQQDDYYKLEIVKNAASAERGGVIQNLWTRTSGGNIQIGLADTFLLGNIRLVVGGVSYFCDTEVDVTITKVEDGDCIVVFKCTGIIEDAANNPLQDDSAGNVTYELIYIFCDNQMFYVKQSFTNVDSITNTTAVGWHSPIQFVNNYFSHQSYKYGTTHTVSARVTVQVGGGPSTEYVNKKYNCYFDITSNDGFALHYIDVNEIIEDARWSIVDEAARERIWFYPDNSGDNDILPADTYYLEFWCQCDDFTAADGDNDDDGDQPAHSKDTELQTALTQSITEDVSF